MNKPIKTEGIEPNTPEWLKLRESFRTASEAAIVLGISPFTSIKDFKLIKAGLKKQYYSAAMRRGHELEDSVRQRVEAMFNCTFGEAIYTRGPYLASLDGYDPIAGCVLEIKVSKRTYTDIKDGHVPPYYAAQIQQQMYCSGAQVAYLAALNPDNDEIALSDPIAPDRQAMRKIEQAWEAFDAMPLPDGPVQADENIDLLRTLEEYATLKRRIEAMEEDLEAIKARVLAFKAADRSVTCRGYTLEYRAPAAKTDYRKACRDNGIDLSKYQSKGEPVWAIKLAPPIFEADDNE
jgi:putative phage-type endonuclease